MIGKRWNRWIICLLGSVFLFKSCTISSRSRPQARDPEPVKEQSPLLGHAGQREPTEADQIIFITMNMARDPNSGTRIIQVQDLLKSPGTLKNQAQQPLLPGPYLRLIFYADQVRLDSLHLEHPLYKHLEYVNAKNQLAHKEIMSDKADFFIRFQQGKANGLKIEERLPDSIPIELIKIKF